MLSKRMGERYRLQETGVFEKVDADHGAARDAGFPVFRYSAIFRETSIEVGGSPGTLQRTIGVQLEAVSGRETGEVLDGREFHQVLRQGVLCRRQRIAGSRNDLE